jgi:hypothetical protein
MSVTHHLRPSLGRGAIHRARRRSRCPQVAGPDREKGVTAMARMTGTGRVRWNAWPVVARCCFLLLLALACPAAFASTPAADAQGMGAPRTYPAGWNLVAVPAGTPFSLSDALYTAQPGDTSYEEVLPSQGTTTGFGYWARISPANQGGYSAPVQLSPGSDRPYSITAPAGTWVMVGDPSGVLPAAVEGADVAYTFDPTLGYQPVSVLQPGQGAWVTSINGGVVTLRPRQGTAQPSAALPPLSAPAPAPNNLVAVATLPSIVPDLPNPLTAVSPMSVASWLATPQPPLSPQLPFFTSRPYSGPFLCPSDVVTTVALLLCGELAANGPSAAPVVFPVTPTTSGSGSGSGGGGCSAGSLCVTADPSVCWDGTDGGTVGGAIGNLTGGTLTLTANCGVTQGTETNSAASGSPVGVVAQCSVPS